MLFKKSKWSSPSGQRYWGDGGRPWICQTPRKQEGQLQDDCIKCWKIHKKPNWNETENGAVRNKKLRRGIYSIAARPTFLHFDRYLRPASLCSAIHLASVITVSVTLEITPQPDQFSAARPASRLSAPNSFELWLAVRLSFAHLFPLTHIIRGSLRNYGKTPPQY